MPERSPSSVTGRSSSVARVGAVVKMEVRDYYTQGRRSWFRLHEKGASTTRSRSTTGRASTWIAYLEVAGILGEARSPLFRTSLARTGRPTPNALTENAALRIVKRRAEAAGLPREIYCHTFRATGITSYLLNGGEVSKRAMRGGTRGSASRRGVPSKTAPTCAELPNRTAAAQPEAEMTR
jgi:integrase